MLRLQTYRFRLKTTSRIEQQFAQFAGCCRYVYNRALALNEGRRSKGQPRLGYVAMCKQLTAWRNDPETAWLTNGSAQSQQAALRNLERAYENFFAGRSGRPLFKKKGKATDSFRCPSTEGVRVDSTNGRVRLPRIGWVKYHNSRSVEGIAKQFCVTHRNGRWFVAIQTEREVSEPVHQQPGTAVGVDLGVINFAALSTGEKVPPLNAYRSAESRASTLHRRLSRKVLGSANWRKAKAKLAKLHERITSRRHDRIHKLTANLSKTHALIAVEGLRIENMSGSAKGTVAKPGRKVRAKAGLNKAILDQGWGEFVRQLEYKTQWAGGQIVRVAAANTSRTCSRCGHCDKASRPTRSRFWCTKCNHEEDADVNAALNVLAAGLAVTACGGDASTPAPQGAGACGPVETGTHRKRRKA